VSTNTRHIGCGYHIKGAQSWLDFLSRLERFPLHHPPLAAGQPWLEPRFQENRAPSSINNIKLSRPIDAFSNSPCSSQNPPSFSSSFFLDPSSPPQPTTRALSISRHAGSHGTRLIDTGALSRSYSMHARSHGTRPIDTGARSRSYSMHAGSHGTRLIGTGALSRSYSMHVGSHGTRLIGTGALSRLYSMHAGSHGTRLCIGTGALSRSYSMHARSHGTRPCIGTSALSRSISRCATGLRTPDPQRGRLLPRCGGVPTAPRARRAPRIVAEVRHEGRYREPRYAVGQGQRSCPVRCEEDLAERAHGDVMSIL
ncbi:hypothetical protein BJ912DRAFT_485468, partial [Pholiota molesta]